MGPERLSPLRTAPEARLAEAVGLPAPPPGPGQGELDPVTEAVIDLIAATGLLQGPDIAALRDRGRRPESVAQGLIEVGIHSSDGMAGVLASRYHLPLVDLGATG